MSWYDELVGRLRLPKPVMVARDRALPGRAEPILVPDTHYVNGHSIHPPFPESMRVAVLAMGCFWGAEQEFWQLDGVYTTAVGYVGGYTPNPTYEEVCSGQTGHTESVLIVFDPAVIDYPGVLRHFWENHDPTQGMRQGNDRGTQYRSASPIFRRSTTPRVITSSTWPRTPVATVRCTRPGLAARRALAPDTQKYRTSGRPGCAVSVSVLRVVVRRPVE
ncbi:hypothetical protein GCM10023319_54720 [Nocardia iowensis]